MADEQALKAHVLQQQKDKAFLLSPSDKFCTQCGQPLPQDQLDTLTQMARCSFEAAKAADGRPVR